LKSFFTYHFDQVIFFFKNVLVQNIALDKPVTVSNIYSGPNAARHSATNVNNGVIIDKNMIPDICVITNTVQNPWIMIDLEDNYHLDFVVLYRRNDHQLYNIGQFRGKVRYSYVNLK
jgi:hypothetical protein